MKNGIKHIQTVSYNGAQTEYGFEFEFWQFSTRYGLYKYILVHTVLFSPNHIWKNLYRSILLHFAFGMGTKHDVSGSSK